MARCVDPQEEEEEEAPKKGGFTMFGRKPVVEEVEEEEEEEEEEVVVKKKGGFFNNLFAPTLDKELPDLSFDEGDEEDEEEVEEVSEWSCVVTAGGIQIGAVPPHTHRGVFARCPARPCIPCPKCLPHSQQSHKHSPHQSTEHSPLVVTGGEAGCQEAHVRLHATQGGGG
jgi:hypothetical protein